MVEDGKNTATVKKIRVLILILGNRLSWFFTNLSMTLKQAFAFERKLKKWSRLKKEALINKNWDKLKDLAECKNETHFKFKNKK